MHYAIVRYSMMYIFRHIFPQIDFSKERISLW